MLTEVSLFAFRRPCPVKYEVYLTGVIGKQKTTENRSVFAVNAPLENGKRSNQDRASDT